MTPPFFLKPSIQRTHYSNSAFAFRSERFRHANLVNLFVCVGFVVADSLW